MNDPEAALLDRLTLAPLPGSEADLLLAAHLGADELAAIGGEPPPRPQGGRGFIGLLASVFGDSVSATQGVAERNFKLQGSPSLNKLSVL